MRGNSKTFKPFSGSPNMKFLFRTDASLQIGSGHLMRCLTLAKSLREQGHTAHFVCREHSGHLFDLVLKNGFDGSLLPAPSASPHPNPPPQAGEGVSCLAHSAWLGVPQARDSADCEGIIRDFAPDWIVCDHYALDTEWESRARAVCASKILIIDDLHDRCHDADVLLDQNLGSRAADYVGLLPAHGRVLAGTRYALLRPEFAAWRERSLARRVSGCLNTVLVSLGGVDKDNFTLRVLRALAQWLPPSCEVRAVMGAAAPHLAAVREFAGAAPYRCRVITAADNMGELLAAADWAVGAAGSSAWERCCAGLPSALLVLADNQRGIARALHDAGAAAVLPSDFTAADLQAACAGAEQRIRQSRAAAALCDGKGVARVVRHLTAPMPAAVLRDVRDDDAARLFAWRNHAEVRRFMFDAGEIAWENHIAWFAKQRGNPDFVMKIHQADGAARGFVSFTRRENGVWEWGFYRAPDCPRGHGTALCLHALRFAFAELGVAAVRGRVLPHNAASLGLHRKLGFRQPETLADGTQIFELSSNEFAY
ncbi:UDP-2,4-diacetamido-2,4,6-trideoxy-beta-L-altropyranose hydrolase [Conchiformibius kuhniae]|uniref:UDP-2,4-diacetamido-2,4, 6-trideoxy-beta-L-altropyranose hydrolase n=2 Tax=Conchiformibius kuhniae TaxID=211502 RepID=A0A8T9MS66_9NEIS